MSCGSSFRVRVSDVPQMVSELNWFRGLFWFRYRGDVLQLVLGL